MSENQEISPTVSGPFKCQLSDCYDRTPHRHTIADLLGKISELKTEVNELKSSISRAHLVSEALNEARRVSTWVLAKPGDDTIEIPGVRDLIRDISRLRGSLDRLDSYDSAKGRL